MSIQSAAPARNLIASDRQAGRDFDLYRDESAAREVYVDGLGGIQVSASVSRLDFFSVIDLQPSQVPGSTDVHEDREIRLRLVMPTEKMLESFLNVLNIMKPQQGQIIEAARKHVDALAALFERLEQK